MYQEIKVNRDLLYLQDVLFDLDNYKFDKDILKLLNELKELCDNKIYLNCDFDITKYSYIDKLVIIRFKKS